MLLPLLSALLLAVVAAGPESRPSAAASAPPRTVAAIRNFDAIDLAGHHWTAEDLRGRVVLIDFWATWCAPCLAELPRLKNLRSRHSRSDFEILGISLDATSRQSLVSWLNRNRIEWPQVHERTGYSGETARRFGVDRLPRTILIDADGVIAAADIRGEALATLVDELVATHTSRQPTARVKP